MTAKRNNQDLKSQFIHSLLLFTDMVTIHINSIEKSIIHLLLCFMQQIQSGKDSQEGDHFIFGWTMPLKRQVEALLKVHSSNWLCNGLCVYSTKNKKKQWIW